MAQCNVNLPFIFSVFHLWINGVLEGFFTILMKENVYYFRDVLQTKWLVFTEMAVHVLFGFPPVLACQRILTVSKRPAGYFSPCYTQQKPISLQDYGLNSPTV